METKVLHIQGMSCAHCEKAVTEALRDLPGVQSVRVDLSKGQATVSYDPQQATMEAMRRAVSEAGYDVVSAE